MNRLPPPPPQNPAATDREDEIQSVMIGTVLGLILAILLLLFWLSAYGAIGRGVGSTGGGQNAGQGDGIGVNPDGGSGDADEAPEEPTETPGRSDADESTPNETDSAGSAGDVVDEVDDIGTVSEQELDDPQPGFSIQRRQATASTTAAASSSSNVSADSGTKMLAGVKVKGNIALVCDVSGSMSEDFPMLVRELRLKFPKDTPLLLVPGCPFQQPTGAKPKHLSDQRARTMYGGGILANDEHVYFSQNTTDAIIFAVKELGRDTVMFNNDLQDGGSESAIEAFEQLRKESPFALSGRSLNCDAPYQLKRFIRTSGGDFKVDPISRTKSPPVRWSR